MNEIDRGEETTDPASQHMVVRAEPLSLVRQSELPDHRIELYARLRTIIETASDTIRTLKEENAAHERQIAEVTNRNVVLDGRLRAATMDLESDERALSESADLLDQLLRGEVASPQSMDTMCELTAPGNMLETDAAAESEPTARHSIFNWVDR